MSTTLYEWKQKLIKGDKEKITFLEVGKYVGGYTVTKTQSSSALGKKLKLKGLHQSTHSTLKEAFKTARPLRKGKGWKI